MTGQCKLIIFVYYVKSVTYAVVLHSAHIRNDCSLCTFVLKYVSYIRLSVIRKVYRVVNVKKFCLMDSILEILVNFDSFIAKKTAEALCVLTPFLLLFLIFVGLW